MSQDNDYLKKQTRRFNRNTKKMKRKMEERHEKQLRIFLQRQLGDAKRAERSIIMQKETQSELEKRRSDEIIARSLRVPGPSDFIEYTRTSDKLSKVLITSPNVDLGGRSKSSGSLPEITPQQRIEIDREEKKIQRMKKMKKQQYLKERSELLKRETEAKFKMQFDRIRDKEEHLKVKEKQRLRKLEIKKRQSQYKIQLKREALERRIKNATLMQEKMLQDKYENHLKKEHLRYMQMVEREILEEYIQEEKDKQRRQKEAKREKNQLKRIKLETNKRNELLRKEDNMKKQLKNFYKDLEEHRLKMSQIHEENSMHGKDVLKQMNDRHQMFVNHVLRKRDMTEEKLNEYYQRLDDEAEERRINANLREEDRIDRINRVYDTLAEQNEIKQAMYESSQYRHEMLLHEIRHEKKMEIRQKALKHDQLVKRIKREREIRIRYREKRIEEKAALRKLRQQQSKLKISSANNEKNEKQGLSTRSKRKKKKKKLVEKSSDDILYEIEDLRLRQDRQLDLVLDEEEAAEKARYEAEISAAPIDRRRVSKDYPRQRHLAYERIHRLRSENDIVLNNKMNEYFKAKHREEKQRSHDYDDDNEIDEKMQSFLKLKM